jgi:Pentapeptide repeats (8 copies)
MSEDDVVLRSLELARLSWRAMLIVMLKRLAHAAWIRWSCKMRLGFKRNLPGVDLAGANLRGMDLSGVNLRRAYLRRGVLNKARPIKADLRRAYLSTPVLILGFWDAAVWVGSGGGD